MSGDPRRHIPGVDALLASAPAAALLQRWPLERVTAALRLAVEAVRAELAGGPGPGLPDEEQLRDPDRYVRRALRHLEGSDRPGLDRVVNATGVVLHTNLGRAVLAAEARAAMDRAAASYGNLEFDLDSGHRGSRYVHGAGLLRELTGAEDALIVNNCAAALVLAMAALARGRGVLVSRGELVEIGGGFRIPEMLEQAGARLVEVGSTNRTRLADYREAAGDRGPIGAILKVHRSNFRISGFTEETGIAALAELGRSIGVPVVHDVGSGLLVSASSLGLPPEPGPAESLAQGADLAVFSGDKLLGGPQAGLIVGRGQVVERLRRAPLCRTFRVDKGTLAALDATLRLYRDPATVRQRVPTLEMLTRPLEELERSARQLAERIGPAAATLGAQIDVAPGQGRVGGGTFPDHALPSWTVVLRPADPRDDRAHAWARRLRAHRPAVVARIADASIVLDVRTLLPGDDDAIVDAVAALALDLKSVDRPASGSA